MLLPFFIFFAPIYFAVINSGLTEPFFGVIAVCSIFFFARKKYLWAAVVISFLPFARNEGFLFLPVFALVLMLRKQYLSILLLGTGTTLLSIIGFFVFHDAAWLFTHNPYSGAKDIYGHGELLHFVKQYDLIWELPLTVLLVSGLIWIIGKLFFIKKTLPSDALFYEELFLIYGCFAIYFVGHSVFWRLGIFSSLGLIRMMAAIIPLAALISLRGFNMIVSPLKHSPYIKAVLAVFCAAWVVRMPFKQWYYPFHLDDEQKVIKGAGKWFNENISSYSKIAYLNSYFPVVTNLDPFDSKKAIELWSVNSEHPEETLPAGSILIWDAHYGPNEGKIPLENLTHNSYFTLIKKFVPGNEFTVMGRGKYEVYFFQRQQDSAAVNYNKEPETIYTRLFDFESGDIMNAETLTAEKAASGTHSCKMNELAEYGAGVNNPFSSITGFEKINKANVQIKISSTEELKGVFIVFEINDSKGKNLSWEGKEIKINTPQNNTWEPFSTEFNVNHALLAADNTFKMYIWNKSKKNFYADDLEIKFAGGSMNETIIWE